MFVVAILAIIAAAIAAGSGSFTGGTSQESNRVEASKIIDFGNRVKDAVTLMSSRYGTPDYGWGPNDNISGGGNFCGDDTCAIWCDSYEARISGSLNCVQNISLTGNDFLPWFQFATQANNDADSGNIGFVLVQNVGTPGKGQIAFTVAGLTATICQAINLQLGYGAVAPVEAGLGIEAYNTGVNLGSSTTITEPTGVAAGTTATQFAGQQSFCVGDGTYDSSAFQYIQVLVVR